MTQQPGYQTDTVGASWVTLKTQPTHADSWFQLAKAYAAQHLPWHSTYAQTQARRCSNVLSGLRPDNTFQNQRPLTPTVSLDCWGDGDWVLSRSGPIWSGCAQVMARLEEVVTEAPGDWLSWLYLARCRELTIANASNDAALRVAVRRAIDLEPIPGESGHLLASWRMRAGQPAQALAALQAVLLQAPQRHGSWLLQAQVQMQLGQEAQAQRSFERAGQSQNPDLLSKLAEHLFQFNFGFEALGVCEAIVQLRPDSAKAWLQLAEMQARLWQVDNAQISVKKALALEPDNANARIWLDDLQATGHSRAQFDRGLAQFEASGLKENAQGAQRLLMQSLYQAHLTPEAVARLHRRVGDVMQEQLQKNLPINLPAPKPLPWNGQRRLRVGYVTSDLHRQHPVNVFMLPILQRHDHVRLEVFIYQTGHMVDEYTRQARACADHWREAPNFLDSDLRQLIIEDRIDVLVDLAGHTATHRLGVFASRAAPVQISYLGYPHSTGLSCMDWMIGDAVVSPPEHAHLFTEELQRVSGSVFCWSPQDHYPLPEESAEVLARPVVFGSFNNLLKVDDVTLAVWARILCACPDAKLILKSAVLADPAVVRQTRERFAAQGITAERLDLRGPSELSRMMQEYLDVDVALDPFPYNGGTTSLQALWMGCPMVSLEGGNFVSRMGASFLTHLGRTEWLAHDVDDYVAKAVALAHQVRERPWGRQAQRAAVQASNLCQIERHTREIERIYLDTFNLYSSRLS